MRELARGAAVMGRVIYALALRETRTRYGQHRAGYLWALAEPLFFIGTFFLMFWFANRTAPGGMEVIPFLATGVLGYDIAVKTMDRVSLSVEGNRPLLFYPHVQPLDVAFARALLEFATGVVVFAIILGAYSLWVGELVIDNFLVVLQGMTLAAVLGLSAGLVLCAVTVMNNAVQRIKGPLLRPLFWVSGLFFTANMVPSSAREYLMWNPVLHCTEIIRDGWFPQYHAHSASPTYVLIFSVVLMFIGLTLERRVRPRVQLT